MAQVPQGNEQNRPQHDSFTESLPPPELSNQPFHALLHNFAQDILRDVRASIGDNGMYGYLLDTQLSYEKQLDKLLAERDRQRGGQEPLEKGGGGEDISGDWDRGTLQHLSGHSLLISAQRDTARIDPSRDSQIRREHTIQSAESPAVQEWLQELRAEQAKRLYAKIGNNRSVAAVEKRFPKEQRGQHEPEQLIALAAAVEVQKRKRTVLTGIGLRRHGNPPFDHLAQLSLPDTRSEVEQLDETELMQLLSRHLGSTGMQYKKLARSSLASRQEEAAWALARERTRERLVAFVSQDATREEIAAELMRAKEQSVPAERGAALPRGIQVIDKAGQRLPAHAFFGNRRGESPFTIEEWAALPLRPVLVPHGEPGTNPRELAEFLFERVLYAPQVCDRQGSAVGLSLAKRQHYIDNIVYSIEHSLPLTATQYMPLVAIGNPIKRNTQSAALAELDTMRRLAEIAQAVEMFYGPGMVWLIGNEAPAFQGPGFNLPGSYVEQFHDDCATIARMIDPEGKRITLFDEAEMLWGTPERKAQWEAFEATKYAELREAYDNPDHPDHQEMEVYLTTYIYPMSTCVDPYRFEPAQGMSAREVAEVYTAIKQETGSVIRGVGSVDRKTETLQELSPAQQELKKTLLSWALDLTYKYRVAMESREALPAFKEIIPEHALPHTMVTKREKLVLYPNSGRGAYFPAHGEPVLKRAKESRQRTVVTVHPWWHIASEAEKYMPMYVAGREEPLYFEEI